MLRRLAVALMLGAATIILRVAAIYYPRPELTLLFRTAAGLTAVYVLGKLLVEPILVRHIKDQKTRYVARKTVSLGSLAAGLLVILTVWVQNPAALFVAYGLVGAGVAIALQDVFKNIVGGLTLFLGGPYGVGDRIGVGDVHGDVIDIGLMYTRILEIKDWVPADQATGRIVTVPNGAILGDPVNNYTANNSFLWDEIRIPLTYDSDWQTAKGLFSDIAEEETGEMASQAADELTGIRRKYYLSRRDTDPQLFLELTDNWIIVHIRYITDVRTRRQHHNAISTAILDAVEDHDDIRIASETVDIVGFPGTDQQ